VVLTYLSKVHNKIDIRKDLDVLMAKLPPSIKNQVTKHLFLNLIKEHVVFKGLRDIFQFVLDSIEPVQFMPEQYIIKEGTKGTHMYMLE
jgi:hypothetical protein